MKCYLTDSGRRGGCSKWRSGGASLQQLPSPIHTAGGGKPLQRWSSQAPTLPGCCLVEAVSAWVLQMQSLLGDPEDADIVRMIVQEPRLLSADMRQVANRLLDMKIAAGAVGTDILKVVEAQPALLLQEASPLDVEETAAQRAQAWQFGLASDGAREWARRARELAAYCQAMGDAHVGFRTGDAPELARWAAKQRADHAAGALPGERVAALEALGFEFDEAAAEWGRWFREVAAASGGGDSPAYTSSEALLLTNWCSVQRIAKRAGVLSQARIALLDSIEFDWSMADALS
ncbi:hypothetical protein WJX81_003795 [Elliptochloris bilobata]|uniref:Helicase-associated domain-containing protein n=1 Tax=Elliptochloris bilobata TaxID=381761 RepID=A0AAW1S0D9_9CHLO